MAIFHQEQEENNPFCLLDELYCEEEKWELYDDESKNNELNLMQDLLCCEDEEEVEKLFIKEKKEIIFIKDDVELMCARKEAIEWIFKVNLYYGFSALTLILSVNYFDRFINNKFIKVDKPWIIQLVSVTCVSLAAKVEETHVPLLLDLQVEGARPVFEPRDIQKMELLVLSTLEWKMHPVTPISFLDHFIRRLGLNKNLHLEFLRSCEEVLLSLLSDWRFVSYLPSVLATATMMHVIDQIQPCNTLHYQTQLLNVLNINKEKVKECYELIVEKSSRSMNMDIHNFNKRKFDQMMMINNNSNNNLIPSSPNGVMDTYYFSSDSSNDSWAWGATTSDNTGGLLSVSSSVSSSPEMSRKKGRVNEQLMPLQLPSLSRVFVDVIESPH